jgi:hypothetical protein
MSIEDSNTSYTISPTDIENLRQQPFENVGIEQVRLTVPVRRPGKTEWFRVHPDPNYVIDAPLIEHGDGLDREMYWRR